MAFRGVKHTHILEKNMDVGASRCNIIEKRKGLCSPRGETVECGREERMIYCRCLEEDTARSLRALRPPLTVMKNVSELFITVRLIARPLQSACCLGAVDHRADRLRSLFRVVLE